MGNSSSSNTAKFTTRIWRVAKVLDDQTLPFSQAMDPEHLSTWISVRHFGACDVEIYVNGSRCKTNAHGNHIRVIDGTGKHEVELVISNSSSWLNSLAEMQLAVDHTVVPEITAMTPDANHANPFTCHVLCQHQDQFELCIGQAHEYRTVWRTYEEMAKLCENVQSAKHLHCSTCAAPVLPLQSSVTELDKYLNALCVNTKALLVNPDCMAFFGFVPSNTFCCCSIEHSNKYSPKPRELEEIVGGPSPTKAVLAYVQRLVHEYHLEPTLQFLLQESNVKPLLSSPHNGHRDLVAWLQTQVPLLLEVIKNKLAQPPIKEELTQFPLPKLNAESLVLDSLALKLLSCSFAECFQTQTQPWQRLYATHSDGNSFQMMATALEYYPGPTLIVIQTTKNHRLGALSTTRWKEDPKFYSEGGGGGALFSLDPAFSIYHRTPSNNKPIVNVQYLNSRSRTLPLGVGFGGTLHSKKKDTSVTTNCPRLWIDEDFSQCFTSGYDTVYTSGPLLGESEMYFKALYIEVWGLGGKPALDERNGMRAQKDRMINNQKKVKNKAEFANNAFDREYLLGGTFNPNEGKGGNAN